MGYLYKRGGIWYISCSSVPGVRRRIRRRSGRSKELAELALKDLEVKIAKDEVGVIDRSRKVVDFVEEYLKYSLTNKSKGSHQRDLTILKKNFLPFLQVEKLVDVTPQIIERYKTTRLKEVKSGTINRELHTIKNMFRKAVEWKYSNNNPCSFIRELKNSEEKPPRFLTKTEATKLLENCESELRDMIVTFLNTGMRKSELVYLEWQDIALERKTITVQAKGDWHPKNYKPRFIPVNDALCEVLKRRKANATTRWVFPNQVDSPHKNNLFRKIKAIYKKVGVKNANIHTLRHTFASHLVMEGVSIAAVRELLGHKQINTTMIYSHLSPDHLKKATEKLGFSLLSIQN